MVGALIIVLREVIEAGLIVGIVLAATRTLPSRGLYVAGGILTGLLGADDRQVGKRVGIGHHVLEHLAALHDQPAAEVIEAVIGAPAVDHVGGGPQRSPIGLGHELPQGLPGGNDLSPDERREHTSTSTQPVRPGQLRLVISRKGEEQDYYERFRHCSMRGF